MKEFTVILADDQRFTLQAERHKVCEVFGLSLWRGTEVIAMFSGVKALMIDTAPAAPAQAAPVSVSDALGVTASVELVAGEALLVSSPLCEAIESTSRALGGIPYAESHQLRNHLLGLLALQKAQLFTSSPEPVAQHIGAV